MMQTNTNIIQAIVVDDEKKGRENLVMLLDKYCPEVLIKGEGKNVSEAFAHCEMHQPDLIFLDIEMPGGNGFELLKLLEGASHSPAIIFTTAYEEYAIQAIKVSALDYLLKPINYQELQKAVQKANSIPPKQLKKQYEVLRENLQSKIKKISIPHQGGFLFLKLEDIVVLEADRNYTKITRADSKTVLVAKSLKEFETLLADTRFFRPHRSFIINLEFVEEFVREDGGYLLLSTKQQVSLAQSRKDAFFRQYNSFL